MTPLPPAGIGLNLAIWYVFLLFDILKNTTSLVYKTIYLPCFHESLKAVCRELFGLVCWSFKPVFFLAVCLVVLCRQVDSSVWNNKDIQGRKQGKGKWGLTPPSPGKVKCPNVRGISTLRPQSRFEANWSRVSWVMNYDGYTNRQTLKEWLLLFKAQNRLLSR